MRRFITFITMLLPYALADDELYSSLNHSQHEPSYFGMLIGLFFVIGLVYLTGFVYKKLTKIKIDNTTDDKFNIQIVSSIPLGQSKHLHVVKINNNHILIGATNETINYIKDLGEDYEDQNR